MEKTMPRESVFFDEPTEAKRVRVLKVYDAAYARACFEEMGEDALAFLSKSLDLGSKYELADSGSDVAWEDVEEEARGGRQPAFIFRGARRPRQTGQSGVRLA